MLFYYGCIKNKYLIQKKSFIIFLDWPLTFLLGESELKKLLSSVFHLKNQSYSKFKLGLLTYLASQQSFSKNNESFFFQSRLPMLIIILLFPDGIRICGSTSYVTTFTTVNYRSEQPTFFTLTGTDKSFKLGEPFGCSKYIKFKLYIISLQEILYNIYVPVVELELENREMNIHYSFFYVRNI